MCFSLKLWCFLCTPIEFTHFPNRLHSFHCVAPDDHWRPAPARLWEDGDPCSGWKQGMFFYSADFLSFCHEQTHNHWIQIAPEHFGREMARRPKIVIANVEFLGQKEVSHWYNSVRREIFSSSVRLGEECPIGPSSLASWYPSCCVHRWGTGYEIGYLWGSMYVAGLGPYPWLGDFQARLRKCHMGLAVCSHRRQVAKINWKGHKYALYWLRMILMSGSMSEGTLVKVSSKLIFKIKSEWPPQLISDDWSIWWTNTGWLNHYHVMGQL